MRRDEKREHNDRNNNQFNKNFKYPTQTKKTKEDKQELFSFLKIMQ